MKNRFIAGLIILLPIVITYWIIKFLFGIITGPFESLVRTILGHYELFQNGFVFLSQDQTIDIVSKILIIASLVILILLIGMIGRKIFFNTILHLTDLVFAKIPIISKIYISCKDFTQVLFNQKSDTFSQVVLVNFPSNHNLVVGLVTSEFKRKDLGDSKSVSEESFVSVLVPGTPNPTVGFLIVYHKKDVIFTTMTVDEAIKYVMSCGSVVPPYFNKKALAIHG